MFIFYISFLLLFPLYCMPLWSVRVCVCVVEGYNMYASMRVLVCVCARGWRSSQNSVINGCLRNVKHVKIIIIIIHFKM